MPRETDRPSDSSADEDDQEVRGLSDALALELGVDAAEIERAADECVVERPDWAATGESPPDDS